MPKPDDRGSLMGLKTNLPKIAPIRTTEEMEQRILGSQSEASNLLTNDQEVKISLRKEGESEDTAGAAPASEPAVQVRRREGTILLNAKIPVSLHTRLKRTAQYNDLSMTDILMRGLEHELSSGRYRTPPSIWGTDED